MKKFVFTIVSIFSLLVLSSATSLAQTGRASTEKTVSCVASSQMPIAVQSAKLIADGEGSLLEYTFENQSNQVVQEVIFWLLTSNPGDDRTGGTAWILKSETGFAPGTQLQLVLPITRVSLKNADSLTTKLFAVAASTSAKTYFATDSVLENPRATSNQYLVTEQARIAAATDQTLCSRFIKQASLDCRNRGGLKYYICEPYTTGLLDYDCVQSIK